MNKYLNKYNQGTIVEKLIYINVGAFLLTFLLNSFGYLFQSNSNLVMNWFSMPSNIDYFITRPWR